ncbi:hypothetical protein GCM10029992_08590 [Glycomyces albus]
MLQGSLKQARRLLLAAGAGAALALSAGSPASAHAAMVGSDPEDGATVETAPASVSATFSEILDGPSTEIAVTGPDGEVIDAGDAEYDGDTFTQPMLYTVPGEYTVAFRVISEDGHRVDGSVAFTVEDIPDELLLATASEPTGEDETTERAETPSEAEATEDDAEAAGADDSGSGALIASILLGALVLVVAGVVVAKLVNRRKNA